jgi:hypothetical protein
MDPSRHSWLLGQSHPVIRLILIAIGVETEYRFVSRSLSAWGPKWEPNTPITIESEMMDLLRLLKLIWQPNLSMLAIGVETEYRSVTRSLSGWGPKGESNAPIAAESKITDFLRLLKLTWLAHDSYRRWERGHRFIEVVEVDMTIGLIHDSYHRWEWSHRFLL